jgi:hypothetical protein
VDVGKYRPTEGGFISLALNDVAGSGQIKTLEIRATPSAVRTDDKCCWNVVHSLSVRKEITLGWFGLELAGVWGRRWFSSVYMVHGSGQRRPGLRDA